MTTTQRMRQVLQQQRETAAKIQAAEVRTPAPAPAAKPAKAKPPVAIVERVQHACGHTVGARMLRDRACDECRAKARKAYNARVAAEREAERRAWLDRYGRLPNGARFETRYHAAAGQWAGTLVVPGADPAGPLAFEGVADGVHELLRVLAAKFWAAVEAKPAA